jgi:hypothetical protein
MIRHALRPALARSRAPAGAGRRPVPRPVPRPGRRRARALPVAIAGMLLALALAACGSGGGATPTAAPAAADAQAVGLVTDIVTSGPVEVASFTMRTEDGQTLEFSVGTLDITGGGFPAEHLSEHRLASEPVLVLYRDEGGKHVAQKLLDAETGSPTPS